MKSVKDSVGPCLTSSSLRLDNRVSVLYALYVTKALARSGHKLYLGQCSSTKSARVRSNCARIVGQVAHCRFPWAVEFRHTSSLFQFLGNPLFILFRYAFGSVILIFGHLKPYGSRLTLGYRERFSRSATSYLSPLNLLTARSRRLILSIRGSDGCGETYGTIWFIGVGTKDTSGTAEALKVKKKSSPKKNSYSQAN